MQTINIKDFPIHERLLVSLRMAQYAVIAFLACVIALAAARPNSLAEGPERIFGGQLVGVGTFPYQASLQLRTKNGLYYHGCGGTIISQRFVLTVARCSANGNFTHVLAGANRNHESSVLNENYFPIKRFVAHEGFVPTKYLHNIALVEVTTPMIFNQRIAAISLNDHFIAQGVSATVSGWGVSDVSVARNSLKHFFS